MTLLLLLGFVCLFFTMDTCFDLLTRSVSLVNRTVEGHNTEKFVNRKHISNNIKTLESTAVYYTDHQITFNF